MDQVEMILWEALWVFEVVDKELEMYCSIRCQTSIIVDVERGTTFTFGGTVRLINITQRGDETLASGRTYQLSCTGLRSTPVSSIHVNFRPRTRVRAMGELTLSLRQLIALNKPSQCQTPKLNSRPYQHLLPKFLRRHSHSTSVPQLFTSFDGDPNLCPCCNPESCPGSSPVPGRVGRPSQV